MEQTQQMIELLGTLRREMNGAVADSMYYSGKRYGLNYGVSIPTIRSIARSVEQDKDLALYLFRQQVRELQLSSFHIAPADSLSMEDIILWEAGITNSELAEEASFALFSKSHIAEQIISRWMESDDEILLYCAILTASGIRHSNPAELCSQLSRAITILPSSRLIASAIVALLSSMLRNGDREQVSDFLSQLPDTAASDKIREEVAWMLEY